MNDVIALIKICVEWAMYGHAKCETVAGQCCVAGHGVAMCGHTINLLYLCLLFIIKWPKRLYKRSFAYKRMGNNLCEWCFDIDKACYQWN